MGEVLNEDGKRLMDGNQGGRGVGGHEARWLNSNEQGES